MALALFLNLVWISPTLHQIELERALARFDCVWVTSMGGWGPAQPAHEPFSSGKPAWTSEKGHGAGVAAQRMTVPSVTDKPLGSHTQVPAYFGSPASPLPSSQEQELAKHCMPDTIEERPAQGLYFPLTAANRLKGHISGTLREVPLREAVKHIGRFGTRNIIFDEPALKQAGISLEQPVSLAVEDVSVESALDTLLQQCGLTYVIQEEVVTITTTTAVEETLPSPEYRPDYFGHPPQYFPPTPHYPADSQPASSGRWLMHDPPQYFPPTPEYPLPPETESLEAASAAQVPPSSIGESDTQACPQTTCPPDALIRLIQGTLVPQIWSRSRTKWRRFEKEIEAILARSRFCKDNADEATAAESEDSSPPDAFDPRPFFHGPCWTPPARDGSESVEDRLSLPISAEFQDVPLCDVVDSLRTATEINIVLDEAALDNAGIYVDEPLSLQVENLPLKSTLKLLLQQCCLTYVIEDQRVRITTHSAARLPLTSVTYPVAELLSSALDGQALVDLVLNVVQPDSWMNASGQGTIQYFPSEKALCVNQSAEVHQEVEALLATVRALQLTEQPASGAFLAIPAEPITCEWDENLEIEHRLTLPITLSVRDTPLGDVLKTVAKRTGLKISLDERADFEQPVCLAVEKVSLKSTLNLLLEKHKLRFIIQDGGLFVTLKDPHALRQAIYPVADLVVPLPDDEDSSWLRALCPQRVVEGSPTSNKREMTCQEALIQLILNTVRPDTWQDVGGKGTIQFFPLGMVLVVNQTAEVHEEIFAGLDTLRKLKDGVDRLYRLKLAWVERKGSGDPVRVEFPKVKATPGTWCTVCESKPMNLGRGTIDRLTSPQDFELLNFRDPSDSWTRFIKTGKDMKACMSEGPDGRVYLVLSISQAEIEGADRHGMLVAGQTFRVIRNVQPGEWTKIVLESSPRGEPQRWLEVFVTAPAPKQEEERIFLGEVAPIPR